MQRHAIELQIQELEGFANRIRGNNYRVDANDYLYANRLWRNIARTLNQKSSSAMNVLNRNLQSGFDRQRSMQSTNDQLHFINKFNNRLEAVAVIFLLTLRVNRIDFSKQSKSKVIGELLQQGADHVEQLQKTATTVEKILQHSVQTETTAIQLVPAIKKEVKTLDGEAGYLGVVVITLQLFAMWAYEKSRQR